jgi:hypothetical protein
VTPKKFAPGLIRGGNRVSGKVMREKNGVTIAANRGAKVGAKDIP